MKGNKSWEITDDDLKKELASGAQLISYYSNEPLSRKNNLAS
jgi:hypothetical protein